MVTVPLWVPAAKFLSGSLKNYAYPSIHRRGSILAHSAFISCQLANFQKPLTKSIAIDDTSSRMAITPVQLPRSKRIRTIEKRLGEPMQDILRRLYWEEGLTQAEVAKRLRVPAGTIGGWMIRFGINQRRLAERAAQEVAV